MGLRSEGHGRQDGHRPLCNRTISRTDFNFGSKFPSAMLSDDIKFTIDVEANQ
jgi:hypothetical protein